MAQFDLRNAINAISDVVQNRPPPLREFDQIYMKVADMVMQADYFARTFDGLDVVFLGDGDSIALSAVHLREGRVYELVGTNCGKLQKNTLRPVEEELTLREACNKIIHAKKVRLDVDDDERGQPYLNPYIYIYGSSGSRVGDFGAF